MCSVTQLLSRRGAGEPHDLEIKAVGDRVGPAAFLVAYNGANAMNYAYRGGVFPYTGRILLVRSLHLGGLYEKAAYG